MGRGVHCTDSERKVIQNLRNDGCTMDRIAQIMKCSKKKVFTALHYYPKEETRGRKRKTTSRFDHLLVRHCKTKPFSSSEELKNELNPPVTSRTIRNRLSEAGLMARSPRRVPFLSKKNVQQRLDFANRHLFHKNWSNVLWSDETKINLFGSDGKMHVRRPKNSEFDPKYTKKTVKHGGGNLMIWGCFSASGVGPLFWIKNKMCAVDYVNILNTVMLPFAEEDMPLKWEFMHDNDPKHSSKLSKQWLQTNKIAVMEWPSQSPDLNPIEHLWGVLKRKIGECKARNKEELWSKIQEAWQSIPSHTCSSLVQSMKRRCEAVIKNKGATTKY